MLSFYEFTPWSNGPLHDTLLSLSITASLAAMQPTNFMISTTWSELIFSARKRAPASGLLARVPTHQSHKHARKIKTLSWSFHIDVSNCFYNSLCSATLMKQAQHHHLKLFLLQIPQPNCHVPPKRAKCLRDLKRHIQLWVLCIHVHSSVPIGDHGTPHSCGKTCAAEPLDDHEADLLGGAVGPALECVFFVTYLHLLDICQGADSIVTARCTMTLNSCSWRLKWGGKHTWAWCGLVKLAWTYEPGWAFDRISIGFWYAKYRLSRALEKSVLPLLKQE